MIHCFRFGNIQPISEICRLTERFTQSRIRPIRSGRTIVLGTVSLGLGAFLVWWRPVVGFGDDALLVKARRISNQPAIGNVVKHSDRTAAENVKGTPQAYNPLYPLMQSANQSRNANASEEDLDSRFVQLARDIPDEDIGLILDLMYMPECQPPSASATVANIVLRRWAERTPTEAAEWLGRLPDNAFKRQGYRQVALGWNEQNPSAAAAWVESLPKLAYTNAARWALASEAVDRDDPVTAAELLVHFTSTADTSWSDIHPDVIAHIVHGWAAKAPEAASDWIEQLPGGSAREAGIQSLIEVWTQKDPSRAGEWLVQLSSGRSRETTVSAYAPLPAAAVSETAIRFAETIQDEKRRATVLRLLTRRNLPSG